MDKFENQLGLAYCEFRDVQAVQIAVSHLNGVSFKGNQIQIEPVPNNLWKDERLRIFSAIEEGGQGGGTDPPEVKHDNAECSQATMGNVLFVFSRKVQLTDLHRPKTFLEMLWPT